MKIKYIALLAFGLASVVGAQNLQTIRQDQVNLINDRQKLRADIHRRQEVLAGHVANKRAYVQGTASGVQCMKHQLVVHDKGLRRYYTVRFTGVNGVDLTGYPRRLQQACHELALRPGDFVSAAGRIHREQNRLVLSHAMLRLKYRG